MKRHEGGKHEPNASVDTYPLSGIFAVCRCNFDGFWFFGPPATERSREIHCVVVLFVPAGWSRDWLGDVSVFALRLCTQSSSLACGSSSNSKFWRRWRIVTHRDARGNDVRAFAKREDDTAS